MVTTVVQIKLVEDGRMPTKATDGSAGYDLYARLPFSVELRPLDRMLVPVGFMISLPQDMEAQIRPRSGLAIKHGVTVLNAPGTIDSDYRGEVGVVLYNASPKPFWVDDGARIAQMVLSHVPATTLTEVSIIDETERGDGGFGSTGA